MRPRPACLIAPQGHVGQRRECHQANPVESVARAATQVSRRARLQVLQERRHSRLCAVQLARIVHRRANAGLGVVSHRPRRIQHDHHVERMLPPPVRRRGRCGRDRRRTWQEHPEQRRRNRGPFCHLNGVTTGRKRAITAAAVRGIRLTRDALGGQCLRTPERHCRRTRLHVRLRIHARATVGKRMIMRRDGVRQVLPGRQRRSVDRLLQLPLRHVDPADVDHKPREAEQHDERQHHQHQHLAILARPEAGTGEQRTREAPRGGHDCCFGRLTPTLS